MQQLASTWLAMDGRKRLVVVLATLAMFAAVFAIARGASSASMALLYSGLDPAAAGEVVKSLEQKAVQYEIRGNAILVEAGKRDQLRMTLAAEGLPADHGKGYELLDSLSGFGTTSQMFDAAYWRAKEGELARTIVSSPLFATARVHIATSPSSPFRGAPRPTASVTVSASSGGAVGARQARALRYLVSSAVAGMSMADVAVIDARSGVVIGDGEDGGGATGADLAQDMRRNIRQLLEARVGPGNAVVEINVETTREEETITERRLDPDSRVPISSQKEEQSTNASGASGGAVTVASNLPQQGGSGGAAQSTSQDSRTTETINYDVSETRRELKRRPGAIRRISLAVLVNEVRETDPATGAESWKPRSKEELAALHDLVASAIGYSPDRGDTITLKSMRFERPEPSGTSADTSVFQKLNLDVMRLVQLATLALVSLVIGVFVIRPMLAGPMPAGALAGPGPEGLPLPGSGAPDGQLPLTGEIEEGDLSGRDLPVVGGAMTEVAPPSRADPMERLKSMIAEREEETVEILGDWIDSSEERG